MNEIIPAGTIVVGIDGSERATVALNWATDQAVLEHRALTLAHAAASSVAPHSALEAASGVVRGAVPGEDPCWDDAWWAFRVATAFVLSR